MKKLHIEETSSETEEECTQQPVTPSKSKSRDTTYLESPLKRMDLVNQKGKKNVLKNRSLHPNGKQWIIHILHRH